MNAKNNKDAAFDVFENLIDADALKADLRGEKITPLRSIKEDTQLNQKKDENNYSGKNILYNNTQIDKLIDMAPQPNLMSFTPYKKKRHILNILRIEMRDCAGFEPAQSWLVNLCIKITEEFHSLIPDFRDKLASINETLSITGGQKEKQDILEKLILDIIREQIK